MFYWFRKHKDVGLLLIRFFIGSRLLYGVVDNIFSWAQMLQFADFLQSFHFPFPLFAAIVSVYSQAVAGMLIILGYYIRLAAMLMIINFLIAYFTVHWGQAYDAVTAPLAMLFAAFLFLFTGAGKYSIDKEPL